MAINGFGYGIYVGGGAADVRIERNYIGTDTTGADRIPNLNSGVSIYNASRTTVIENLISGQGTIGSGSGADGVYVGEATTFTLIQNNLIGTNAAGTAALGNAGFGVKISGTTSNPPAPPWATQVTDNVISGNELGGVVIQRGATGTVVADNKIGTGSDTAVAIGNLGSGVEISESPNNLIGGTGPSALSNTIANNGRYGIQVWGAASTGNSFMGNEIRNNAYMGIDLNGDYGVTANDVPDVNGIQNFPVITSADSVGGTTHVALSVDGIPNSGIWVEIFTNASCDWIGGNGEGAERFDAFQLSLDGTGHVDFLRTLADTPAHSVLTATVTNYSAGGSSSEFSACYTIPAPTNPTAVVAAYPSAAPQSAVASFLMMATVSPGSNPPSTDITLNADLSPIGGPTAVSINDLGIHYGCDDIAGDGTYIGCGTVGAGITPGSYTIPVTVTDAQGRTSLTSFPFTVLASGTGNVVVTVHDASGGVLPGLQVTVTSVPPGTTTTAGTDGAGQAAFPGLAAGTWNVTVVTVPPGSYGTTQFQVVAGETLSVNIYPQTAPPAAPTGVTVYDGSGTVVPDNVPVTVTDPSTGASTVYYTDSNGQVFLPLGVWDVQVGGFESRLSLTGLVTNIMIRR